MVLTQAQKTSWEKARQPGAGGQAVGLSDEACSFIVGCIARDLKLTASFPELPPNFPEVYSDTLPTEQILDLGVSPISLYERLIALRGDADTYFACLASLQRARLKYATILSYQPLPTLEQVGPRSLLQFGQLPTPALIAFLFWRKWMFDIDNRAGQETGYLFEPVVANAIGGVPIPAKSSPIKRRKDENKGRQVDCVIGKSAYEIKIRVTIAASGQGRWREELDFPEDCKASGFTPVLVVLDSTENTKLAELSKAFLAAGGQVYVGAKAWEHLDSLAGDTMAEFLERYVRAPLSELVDELPDAIPPMRLEANDDAMEIQVGDSKLTIPRKKITEEFEEAMGDD